MKTLPEILAQFAKDEQEWPERELNEEYWSDIMAAHNRTVRRAKALREQLEYAYDAGVLTPQVVASITAELADALQ